MNTMFPSRHSVEFTEDCVDDFARETTFPPPPVRKEVKEILERPDLMNFMQEFVEVARQTRVPAKHLLEEWGQIEDLKRNSNL